MNLIFILIILSKEKPVNIRPKNVPVSKPLTCISETNPCGSEIYNGTLKCCPGLECYEETACIDKNLSIILEKYNVTFGNCYKKQIVEKFKTNSSNKKG